MVSLVLRRKMQRRPRGTTKPNRYVDVRASPERCLDFRDVKVGERFTLMPNRYINIDFVKTGPRSAEQYTWDEYAPKQYFPEDFPVYVIERAK